MDVMKLLRQYRSSSNSKNGAGILFIDLKNAYDSMAGNKLMNLLRERHILNNE